MAKYINAMQTIIENQKTLGMSADNNLDNEISKFPVVIEFTNSEIESSAVELGKAFTENEALVLYNNRPIAHGGRLYSFLEFYNHAQPVIKFIGEAIASEAIVVILKMGLHAFTSMFNKSKEGINKSPLYIEVAGKNKSNLQFKFFSYFEKDDIENAIKAMPSALKEYPLTDGVGQILFFDRKDNKWHVVGSEVYWED